jgi:polysaccharide pyruvyl transferase CsaB
MSAKQVMLSGYYGFENLGDELILQVLVQALQRWGHTPWVLSGHPEETAKAYQVNSIQRIELHHIWAKLKEMDALISGGGGLFQDVTGLGSPVYYGGLIELAHWFKCPVAFFGQGVGPLTTQFGRWMTRRALSHSDLVVVRDVKSHALVYKLTTSKPELMADPVWTWQPDEALSRMPKQGLGVSLRPWSKLSNEDILHLGAVLASQEMVKEEGVNLIDCQSGADILPLAKLEQYLKDQNITCRWFSGTQAIEGIAQSKALVGMRFHAILLAAQFQIPIISLSYDPKVQLLSAHLKLTDIPVERLKTSFSETVFAEKLDLADAAVIAEFRQSAEKGLASLERWLSKCPKRSELV